MKFLFDLFPVILFFGVFKIAGLHYAGLGLAKAQAGLAATEMATVAAIVGTLAQVAWSWGRHRRIGGALWSSLVLILMFGGATLVLHDTRFIQVKPTVLYWLFAVALLAGRYAFRKNIIRSVMGEHLQLPAPLWDKLNLSWAAFFAVLGALNLYVARHYSLDTWVNFKLFGTFGLMVSFVIAQAVVLSRHLPDDKEPS